MSLYFVKYLDQVIGPFTLGELIEKQASPDAQVKSGKFDTDDWHGLCQTFRYDNAIKANGQHPTLTKWRCIAYDNNNKFRIYLHGNTSSILSIETNLYSQFPELRERVTQAFRSRGPSPVNLRPTPNTTVQGEWHFTLSGFPWTTYENIYEYMMTSHPSEYDSCVNATVIFFDLRNSTRLIESFTLQKVHDLFSKYYERMETVILSSFTTNFIKHIGDGSMVVSGISGAKTHVKDSIKRVFEMHDLFESMKRNGEFPPDGRMGFGVATGMVSAGLVGGPGRRRFDVFGPVVNLACRLESETKETDDDIVVMDDVYHALSPGMQTQFKVMGEKAIRGFDVPLKLFSAKAHAHNNLMNQGSF